MPKQSCTRRSVRSIRRIQLTVKRGRSSHLCPGTGLPSFIITTFYNTVIFQLAPFSINRVSKTVFFFFSNSSRSSWDKHVQANTQIMSSALYNTYHPELNRLYDTKNLSCLYFNIGGQKLNFFLLLCVSVPMQPCAHGRHT